MKRVRLLMGIFFTGIVPLLNSTATAELKKIWLALDQEDRDRDFARINAAIVNRRNSMTGNAEKGGLLFGALAFAIAVATALALISPKGVTLVLGLGSITLFVVAAGIIVLMISPKFKVFRRKRNRVPTALKLLRETAADRQDAKRTSGPVGWPAFLEAANILEKREMLVLVERRALLTASLCFCTALVIVEVACGILMARVVL